MGALVNLARAVPERGPDPSPDALIRDRYAACAPTVSCRVPRSAYPRWTTANWPPCSPQRSAPHRQLHPRRCAAPPNVCSALPASSNGTPARTTRHRLQN